MWKTDGYSAVCGCSETTFVLTLLCRGWGSTKGASVYVSSFSLGEERLAFEMLVEFNPLGFQLVFPGLLTALRRKCSGHWSQLSIKTCFHSIEQLPISWTLRFCSFSKVERSNVIPRFCFSGAAEVHYLRTREERAVTFIKTLLEIAMRWNALEIKSRSNRMMMEPTEDWYRQSRDVKMDRAVTRVHAKLSL